MQKTEDPRNPGLKKGKRICGYRIEKIIKLPEINAVFYELAHLPTGAAHIHISRPDPENAFAVIFKTVPRDSTGVAHILEHTVLCGSKKYPVRDPFFSMMKRSLSTFMNALTASDWTMYPFATQNQKDFYNLISVYLDAAFYPSIDRLSFKQEGHRLEFETDPGTGKKHLVYKGVVYNEMKGAMSSPDQVMSRSLLNALYPDTTYSYNSGGDPELIPELTHEQLLEFHRHHYHPSNAFFYTYGELPLADHLRHIEDTVLNRFSRTEPDTEVPSQPRWNEPRTAVYTYPLDSREDTRKKSQACMAWLTADIRDAYEVLILSVLEQVLLGNPGAPLRKALIDSGLGSTLSDGSGLDAENKDTMFACGLKDVDPEDAGKIEEIIFNVLTGLAEKGVDRRLVETALHQIEFYRREVTNTPFPYGVKLLLRFTGDWLHHGDPAGVLKFDDLVERFLHELDTSNLMENRIRKYFLDNPHRVCLTLEPDTALFEKRKEKEKKKLALLAENLGSRDMERIRKDAEALRRLQEADEDLSCLPKLEIQDILPDIRTVHSSGHIDKCAADLYDQPTSGIFYYTAAIGIRNLEPELIPLVPLFCFAMTQCGTTKYDYVELARRIDQYTGGMAFSVTAANRFSENNDPCLPMLTLSAKCLSRNTGNMFDLLGDLLKNYSFADHERLANLLMEIRSEMESSVVRNGHRFAVSLAARGFSAANALNETWNGIHQLKKIKELTENLDQKRLEHIASDLDRIAETVFRQNNIRAALIGQQEEIDTAAVYAESLMSRILPAESGCGFDPPEISFQPKGLGREGWATSTAVSFVARIVETNRLDHEDAPVLEVISKLLKSMFLHREIREKGGAYGGFSVYQRENGLFCFASYRDPQIVNTLRVYEASAEFLNSGDYDTEDVKEAILQACSEIDRPDPPGPAATKAFYRKLIGLSDELRRKFKKRLLEVTLEQVRAAAAKYFSSSGQNSAVAVISSEDQLRAANLELRDRPLDIKHI
ncbi:MAG: insulinase family protein [Desulfobacteraceae bacterium]|nr:insulinase family protein [Desulfobacteraceae bacterium]